MQSSGSGTEVLVKGISANTVAVFHTHSRDSSPSRVDKENARGEGPAFKNTPLSGHKSVHYVQKVPGGLTLYNGAKPKDAKETTGLSTRQNVPNKLGKILCLNQENVSLPSWSFSTLGLSSGYPLAAGQNMPPRGSKVPGEKSQPWMRKRMRRYWIWFFRERFSSFKARFVFVLRYEPTFRPESQIVVVGRKDRIEVTTYSSLDGSMRQS